MQYAEYPPPMTDDTFMTLVNANVFFEGVPSPGDTITVGAITYTAVAGSPGTNEFQIAGTAAESRDNFLIALTGNPVVGAAQDDATDFPNAYIIFIGDTGTVSVSGENLSARFAGVIQMVADPAPGKSIDINGLTFEFVA